jgi:hypothetical protein
MNNGGAGVLPYFPDRPAIESHMVQSGALKWDFDWSIGTLRPDIVVGLSESDEEVRRALQRGVTR